jgi:hypothetical protein
MNQPESFPFGPEEAALLEKSTEEQVRRLIDYLGTTSKRKLALATHVLSRGGPPIVPLLIREAFARGRRPAHALRLLGIVGRIGGPVSFDDWMLLSAGRASPSKLVSAKCSQLLLELGHAVAKQGVRARTQGIVSREI